MKIVIKMLSTAEMRRRHKVAENGPVQAAIDSEFYQPFTTSVFI